MDLHDNVLKTNLCLKEQELESLISIRDAGINPNCQMPIRTPLTENSSNVPQQIHFNQFQYKVFKEPKPEAYHRSAYPPQKRNFSNRREDYSSVAHIPYPTTEINLKKLNLGIKIQRRKISPYEKVIKKLQSAQVHLKELTKQREKLLNILQKNPERVSSSSVEKMTFVTPNCCRKETESEDLSLIIQTATIVIQSTTMEINLYRGLILLIGNNCHSFDAYSSMTSRVMIKEFEECVDDVMALLSDFIRDHKFIEKFEDFRKHNELLAGIDALITCIRCCATYTWAMESRYGIKASATANETFPSNDGNPEKYRDINIGSV